MRKGASRLVSTVRGPAVIVAVLLLVFGVVPPRLTENLEVYLDVSAPEGTRISFQSEEAWRGSQVRTVPEAGPRRETFTVPKRELSRTLFEIEHPAGVDVQVRAVGIIERHHVVARYGPEEIATWPMSAAQVEVDSKSVHFRSPEGKASFDHWKGVRSWDHLPEPMRFVARLANSQIRRHTALMLAFAVLTLGVIRSRRGRWAAATAGLGCAGALATLSFVLHRPHGVASPDTAVGRSTYLGISLPTNSRALVAIFIVASGMGVASALLWRWRRTDDAEPVASIPGLARRPAKKLVAGAIAVLVALTLAMFFPDVSYMVKTAGAARPALDWDLTNLTTWEIFGAQGLVPMRDFWYPYGNTLVFSRYIDGTVLFAIYYVILALGYGWVFWVASGRRVVATFFASLLFVLVVFPSVHGTYRYGLALLVALTYSAIDPDGEVGQRRLARIVFGVVFGLALFIEPVLVGYAAAGVGVAIGLDLVRGRNRGLVWWSSRLAGDFLLPAGIFMGWLLITGLRGQLPDTVALYRSLRQNAVYSAVPTDLRSFIDNPSGLEATMLWITPGLLAVGAFLRLTEHRSVLTPTLGSRLLVTAASAAPILQKHGVRPLGDPLLLFPLTAATLGLLSASARREHRSIAATGFGLSLAVIIAFPGPTQALKRIPALPRLIARAAPVVTDRSTITRASVERFSPDRFRAYEESAVADDLRPRLDPTRRDNLVVLGDAAILYPLLRQIPPWHVAVHDSSPLQQQRRIVRWMNERKPPFVVLARPAALFDDVPHPIRIPIVFQRVIEDFTLDHSVGVFEVLRRRAPGEPIDGAFWTRILSSEIKLGFMPNVSTYGSLKRCSPEAERRCGRFLRVKTDSRQMGVVAFPLTFGGRHFTVAFQASARREYVVPLARTWPWALSHDVSLGGPPPTGWTAEVVTAEQDDGRLY